MPLHGVTRCHAAGRRPNLSAEIRDAHAQRADRSGAPTGCSLRAVQGSSLGYFMHVNNTIARRRLAGRAVSSNKSGTNRLIGDQSGLQRDRGCRRVPGWTGFATTCRVVRLRLTRASDHLQPPRTGQNPAAAAGAGSCWPHGKFAVYFRKFLSIDIN